MAVIRQISLFLILLLLLTTSPGLAASSTLNELNNEVQTLTESEEAASPDYTLAIFSDLHVSSENQASLNKATSAISSMKEINAVALLGDLCKETGSPSEYEAAARVVKAFGKTIYAIPGNHDVIYEDELNSKGKKERASKSEMKDKLDNFVDLFDQKAIRFSVKKAGYLLVFLPNDALGAKSIAAISEDTLDFLEETLSENRKVPTILFAHAPLENSYEVKVDQALSPLHAAAQPSGKIKEILAANPQVFMWVAGHRHTKPGSADFNSSFNKVDNVNCIHVPNITAKSGWAMTLELYSGKAVVQTYDVIKSKWLTDYRRVYKMSDVQAAIKDGPLEISKPGIIEKIREKVEEIKYTAARTASKVAEKAETLKEKIARRVKEVQKEVTKRLAGFMNLF